MTNSQKLLPYTVVIPIKNGASTLSYTLSSLAKQTLKPKRIIIIDDNSNDNSLDIVNKLLKKYKLTALIIKNTTSFGLAHNYNLAIKHCQTPILVTIHQDMELYSNTLAKLIKPFSSKAVVASSHLGYYPLSTWIKYNIWQKAYFDRHVGKYIQGLNGQCDAFLVNKVKQLGGFDDKHFRTAGEDGDIINKLKPLGIVAPSSAVAIHLHQLDNKFSIASYLHKHRQYGQAQGTLLIKYGLLSLSHFIYTFFREIMFLCLFTPIINVIAILTIVCFCFMYTRHTFVYEFRNPKIIFLPIVNFASLVASTIGTIEGIVYQRQTM